MLGAPHLQALLVYSIVKYQPSEYGSYRFPAWAELLGILMGLLSCLMIPAGMLVAVLREEGSLWEVSLPHPCLLPAPQPVALPWAQPLEQKTRLLQYLFQGLQDSFNWEEHFFLTSSLGYESAQICLVCGRLWGRSPVLWPLPPPGAPGKGGAQSKHHGYWPVPTCLGGT